MRIRNGFHVNLQITQINAINLWNPRIALLGDGGVALLGFVDACVFSMKIDNSPTNDRGDCGADHAASVKRCVPAL